MTQGAIGWFIQRDLDHGVQPSSYNQRKEHPGRPSMWHKEGLGISSLAKNRRQVS